MVQVYILFMLLLIYANDGVHTVGRTRVDHNQTPELEYLKAQLNALSNEISILNINSSKLAKEITDNEINCDQEIQQLKHKYGELFLKAEKKQQFMSNLLHKIQDEEEVHVKLEEELKRVSKVLELYEHQYQVVSSDLQLMELRRNNGTSVWCTQLSHALATEDDEALLIRAHMASPYKARKTKSQEELEIMIVKRKLKIKTTLKNTISAKIDSLIKSSAVQLEFCKRKQADVNQIIKESFLSNKVSDENIKSFTEDLSTAIEFSKAVRLEIASGKKLLEQVKKFILMMKNKMEDFKSDYRCFSKIMSLD